MAGIPVAAMAAAPVLTTTSGSWVRVFTQEVETAVGRSVRVDAASMKAGGLGRSFRELDVLTKNRGALPRGTMQFMLRSVNCATGTTRVEQWQMIGANGATLGGSATPGTAQRVRWDNEDGLVIRYVCQGILPR
ncbi:hypothetical protein A8V01_04950 [Novosphingobium guangzhouense]|uniref:Uncharacterized protein n=2 Tax=Novosphingobium guangzhouense TaxID=1850347 RepID=A0A2K2FYY9_9SPHN|nr:hypothetical protein A8V01_04950 [Novosphingobium guangzhouense]